MPGFDLFVEVIFKLNMWDLKQLTCQLCSFLSVDLDISTEQDDTGFILVAVVFLRCLEGQMALGQTGMQRMEFHVVQTP